MSLRTSLPALSGITVEYLGLPGVGKSTLSHLVAELWRSQGGEVDEATFTLDHRCSPLRRRMSKGLLAAYTLVRHPGRALRWFLLIACTQQRSWRELCHVAFNWCYICGLQESRSMRRKLLLLDEGLFQALWSIAYRAETMETFRRSALKPLSAVLSSVTVLVVVTASTATIAQRLSDRSERFSLLELDKLLRDGDRQMDHAQACLSCIEELAVQCAGVQGSKRQLIVLCFDNSTVGTLPAIAQQIVGSIRALAAAPAMIG